jgi:23S rRNA (guanosine2251-2'-O)-methyltransferase
VSNLICGRNPVVEALEEGKEISKIWLQQGTRGDLEKEIRHWSKERGIPVSFVPKVKLDKMVKGNHQGIAALLSPLVFSNLESLIPHIFEQGKTPLIVVLDGITDVRNIGAIARSAEVLGADGLVMPLDNSGQINEETVKSSAGALLRLPVCRVKSLVTALDFLSASGIHLIAADLQGDSELYSLDLTEPIAVLLGSEGEGLSRKSLERADHRFIIPQYGHTDSLNVSVSCGIILYEATRQRALKGEI